VAAEPQFLEPGQIITHPQRPDWGKGQVQSVIGSRVTVNFEHAGKVVINTDHVALDPVPADDRRSGFNHK
jgi:ABC-type uncharacterized transport system YnjBCD ATPase subunit